MSTLPANLERAPHVHPVSTLGQALSDHVFSPTTPIARTVPSEQIQVCGLTCPRSHTGQRQNRDMNPGQIPNPSIFPLHQQRWPGHLPRRGGLSPYEYTHLPPKTRKLFQVEGTSQPMPRDGKGQGMFRWPESGACVQAH